MNKTFEVFYRLPDRKCPQCGMEKNLIEFTWLKKIKSRSNICDSCIGLFEHESELIKQLIIKIKTT